jgi:hypothetical protein
MAIQFVVEDGTGKADATSYATVAQFKQYCDNNGIDYTNDADTAIEVYLNQATKYIDMRYKFMGFPTKNTSGNLQSLQWPRTLVNTLGETWRFAAFRNILSTEVPREVLEATCYLATEAKCGPLMKPNEHITQRSFGGAVHTVYGRYEGFKSYPYVNQLFRYLQTPTIEINRVN